MSTTLAPLSSSPRCPDNTYWTYHHEPEGGGSETGDPAIQANFRFAFQQFYTAAKAGNPNVWIGTSHLAYQWRNNTPSNNPNLELWWPGDAYVDFIAADIYLFDWQAAVPLYDSSSQSGLCSGTTGRSPRASP